MEAATRNTRLTQWIAQLGWKKTRRREEEKKRRREEEKKRRGEEENKRVVEQGMCVSSREGGREGKEEEAEEEGDAEVSIRRCQLSTSE